jgi:hypothetical protein
MSNIEISITGSALQFLTGSSPVPALTCPDAAELGLGRLLDQMTHE